eukprot:CAMPEP_0181323376 /NCGR_PEP_ID=MMETSP1101-20121128/19751_1 /TAXON_ID=46948 /ORGANISM="Rhodomonas abbreviata, Strain Caron Lab Isolate" /LENGTH=133 /DNA_ID=CAMNT_0023431397 /DNA_START=31 /DNA_END=432 /DNA_ORIENTATION=-
MFADAVHFQSLFSSHWPATTIGDLGDETGNNGATWNYGANFGGGTDYLTAHDGGVGMFGSTAVNAPLNFPLNLHPCDDLKQYENDPRVAGFQSAATRKGFSGIADACKNFDYQDNEDYTDYITAFNNQLGVSA